MKNILIIELGGSHMENIYSIIELMNIKNCPVHFIGNKSLVSLLPEPEKLAGIESMPDNFSLLKQLSTFLFIRRYIKNNNIDAVIIGTTEIKIIRNLLLFLPKLNYTGIVHNAQKVEKSTTFKKILFRRMRKYFVFGNYLLSQIKPYPLFSVMPLFAVHFPKPKTIKCTKPAGEFWVVIPGGVAPERRDYTAFLNALKKIPPAPQVKIILLGRLGNDTEIATLINTDALLKDKTVTFNTYLDYSTFHSYLLQSDIVLPLLKIDDSDFYSNKRISGSFNLGLGYKLPFLLSSNYKQNKDLAPFAMYYDSMEELAYLINSTANDRKEYNRIKTLYNQCSYCSVEAQADALFNFIINP